MKPKTKLIFYSASIVSLIYGLLAWNYVCMGAGIVSLAVAEWD